MATLWARTVSYRSVRSGDDLPILVKHESRATIDLYARNASADRDTGASEKGVSGGPVASGAVTLAYVAELLEKAFPLPYLMSPGSHLEVEVTRPIGADETVSFTGRVTGKREDAGSGLVECEVVGTNQLGQTVTRATAIVAFPISNPESKP